MCARVHGEGGGGVKEEYLHVCKGAWRRGRRNISVRGCTGKGEEKHQCERVHRGRRRRSISVRGCTGEGGGGASV